MDKQFYFERNLLALDREHDDLCERLSATVTTKGRYRMLEARDGGVIPSIVDGAGKAHPLHSLIDPVKEAERTAAAVNDAGFLVFMGFGGGYLIEAALKNTRVEKAVIIDFDADGIAEILSIKDFVKIFNDKRVVFLVDPEPQKIETLILEEFKPVLHGNLRSIPLRARCDAEKERFLKVSRAVKSAVEKISMDYSVQSQFGKRWFSNTIRNILVSEQQNKSFPPVHTAAVCAAGPSLDDHLNTLSKRKKELFIIATDTGLGALLNNGITPDAVISIDCQHITYYHFLGMPKLNCPVFLDISSPPQIASYTQSPYFFSDAHPLSFFAAKYYKAFPYIDISGGNVTYAALSLASALNAKKIELYGADFSYPRGKIYTKGAYIYPYYHIRQHAFQTMETLVSSFIFRSNSLSKQLSDKTGAWFYQTPSLLLYKNAVGNLSNSLDANIMQAEGGGDTILFGEKKAPRRTDIKLFSTSTTRMSPEKFLSFYLDGINSLPPKKGGIEQYLSCLSTLQTEVFFSLLPLAVSIQSSHDAVHFADVFEDTKQYGARFIHEILKGRAP